MAGIFRAIAAFVSLLAAPALALAGSLANVFESPQFAHLGLAPLGPALAATMASTYPVASASSSVVYVYDPALDTLERRPGVLGPLFGERAETVGRGRLDLQLTYSNVRLATIDGASVDDLVNQASVDGRFLFVPVSGGVTLEDGRFTTLLPVRVSLDIGVTAHIATPSVTYGLTPDLDVNLTLPILRTSLDVTARTRVPDPRHPAFMLPAGSPLATSVTLAESESSTGIGDVLLRAKYVVHRNHPVDVALGLGLSLPTGDPDDFQGTGTTRVRPALIASRDFGTRVEVLANCGIDLDADDVDRSVVGWAAGATLMLLDRLALPVVFLGRHQLAAPADPIALPFFFQIERADQYDASMGLRWRVAGSAVVSANALVPLNDQGLRTGVVPTVQAEWTF